MHKFTRKTVAIAAGTALCLSGAGAAFAYWTTTGSGTATATTAAAATAVTINQTALTVPQIAALRPGAPVVPLAGNFTNPTDGPLHVTAVTASVTGVDGGHAGCAFVDYVIGGASTPDVDIAPGTGGAWTGLTIALTNTAVNQDACKGAVVTITYASS